MVQAQQRVPVRGPTFIRLLARLADLDLAPSSEPLPDRLSQWLDWNHALSLATALDARPAVDDAAAPEPEDMDEACAQARATLAASIRTDPVLVGEPADAAPADYAVFRQCHLARQRAIQSTVGRLRGRLRDALAQRPGEIARLAEVDAVMEGALTPREHTQLAKVPALLERRFARLQAAASHGWLDGFRRDIQGVLLAELDVRFQPVDALLAALRTD